jgi:hypothetical protein
VTGGEESGHDKTSREKISDPAAQIPRQAELDAIGQHGSTFRGGVEAVLVPPEDKRALHAGIDEQSGRFDCLPSSLPAEGQGPLSYSDGKKLAGPRFLCRLDTQDAEPGGTHRPQVAGVAMKGEELRGSGGHCGRSLIRGHGDFGPRSRLRGRHLFIAKLPLRQYP